MKLLEYSVIYTNRATNLMSQIYKTSFKKLNTNLCNIYNAKKCAIIPGSGSSAMEAVARQFGTDKKCLIIRNGNFSYRWSQILEWGHPYNITDNVDVLKAQINTIKTLEGDNFVKVTPPSIAEICDSIIKNKPNLICVPHVETSTGLILSNDYLKEIGNVARKVNSIFCLDGIAAGTIWANLEDLNVDLYITAPQKGWTSPASCGVVMLGERSLKLLENTQSNSFTYDLNKWNSVTDAYMDNNFMYHCTVPTDSIIQFSEAVEETLDFGLDKAQKNAILIGSELRKILENKGFNSIANEGYKAPTVIVSQCAKNMVDYFIKKNIQVTGFVPFMLDEPKEIHTFRIGLFGLDKLSNPQKTIENFATAL